jgi:hypothetical protein
MGLFLLRLPIFTLALSLAPAAMSHVAAATPTPPAVAMLAGTYRYVGNWKQDEARIEASIDQAITSLGWLGRKIAASRLESHLKRPSRVVIARAGDDLSVTMDDYEAAAPLNGAKRDVVAPNGRESKLSYRVADDAILQLFVGEHAERESTYSLDSDGRLTMTVYMTSEKLASPIAYELVYEKVP